MLAPNLAQFLDIVYGRFEAWEPYSAADDILQKRFHSTRNDNLLVVYEKAALLDRVYGTNVFDAFKIAQHIIACEIDPLLDSGDPSVISKIRAGHEIRTKKNSKEKDLYSFATKYASWHRSEVYPIYDRLIGRLLPILNRGFQFYNGQLSEQSLRTYSTLAAAIDSLTERVDLTHLRYKKIDKALWLWAKFEFRPDHVNDEIAQAIVEAKESLQIRL